MAKDKVPTQSELARQSTGAVGETVSSAGEIASFLAQARRSDPSAAGRLIFALDATMSRQPTWDRACQIQASMFDAVAKAGGLSVQLVYFRGFGESRASKWVMNAKALADLMTGIDCRGGQTQIAKVLSHANKENARKKVDALVFIGDAMEEEPDRLCQLAGELGLADVVRFVPPVAQTDLVRWYSAADVVAVPSYNESFGLVAVEAQATGTPVVAAAVGGLTTAVRDGVSGLLVDGHGAEAWADALERVLRDPSYADRLGRGALEQAALFSWDRTAEATLAVYEQARELMSAELV